MLLEENTKRNNSEYVDSEYMGLEYDAIITTGEFENLEDEKHMMQI